MADETFPDRLISMPTLRITVTYREVGPGVDSVELTWECVIPDVHGVADVLAALTRPRLGAES